MVRPQRLNAMKKHSVTDPSQIKFASAVRNYVPKVAGKLPLLMPYKEGIAELRRKHASYKPLLVFCATLTLPSRTSPWLGFAWRCWS